MEGDRQPIVESLHAFMVTKRCRRSRASSTVKLAAFCRGRSSFLGFKPALV